MTLVEFIICMECQELLEVFSVHYLPPFQEMLTLKLLKSKHLQQWEMVALHKNKECTNLLLLELPSE